MLTPRRRRVLLAAATWTAYVWGSRLFLMWRGDESLAFKAVHTTLAAVSLAFALAITRIALADGGFSRRRPGFSSKFSTPDVENLLEKERHA